jgi:multidrug efflux pump subunit AcrA (membrane-fusion protein)
MLRLILIIVGLVLAAFGGVIAYRALFLDPRTTVVITDTSVREWPNTLRVGGGLVLLLAGAGLAFIAARRQPR